MKLRDGLLQYLTLICLEKFCIFGQILSATTTTATTIEKSFSASKNPHATDSTNSWDYDDADSKNDDLDLEDKYRRLSQTLNQFKRGDQDDPAFVDLPSNGHDDDLLSQAMISGSGHGPLHHQITDDSDYHQMLGALDPSSSSGGQEDHVEGSGAAHDPLEPHIVSTPGNPGAASHVTHLLDYNKTKTTQLMQPTTGTEKVFTKISFPTSQHSTNKTTKRPVVPQRFVTSSSPHHLTTRTRDTGQQPEIEPEEAIDPLSMRRTVGKKLEKSLRVDDTAITRKSLEGATIAPSLHPKRTSSGSGSTSFLPLTILPILSICFLIWVRDDTVW